MLNFRREIAEFAEKTEYQQPYLGDRGVLCG